MWNAILHNYLYRVYQQIDAGSDAMIPRYAFYYLFTLFNLYFVTVLWDLLRLKLSDYLFRGYDRIRAKGSLRTMTRIAESYYMLRKILRYLSFGTVRYGTKDLEPGNTFVPTGPVTLLAFLGSLFRGAFSINLPNVLVWLLIISYTRPGLFHYPAGFSLDAVWNKFINLHIEKLSAWVALFLGLIAFTTSSGIRSRIRFGEEALVEAQKAWARLEHPFSTIVYGMKKNIEQLNRSGDLVVSYWLKRVMDDDSYGYYDGNVNQTSIHAPWALRNWDPFRNYIDFSSSAEAISEVLDGLDDKGLRYPFYRVARSIRSELVHLGLWPNYSEYAFGYRVLDQKQFRELIDRRAESEQRHRRIWQGSDDDEIDVEPSESIAVSAHQEAEFLREMLADAIIRVIQLQRVADYIYALHKHTGFWGRFGLARAE